MADEPGLPRLTWNPITEAFTNNLSRKRVRLSDPISSDPALFSSDDDPSADNYTGERRKTKYRGPWFCQQPASDSVSESPENILPTKRKRKLERQFDSGVWLGSDGTDLEDIIEEVTSSEVPGDRLRLGPFRGKQALKEEIPSPEELALRQIELCLDEGQETIDLSSRGLKSLSNSAIRPLQAFTCVPLVTEGVSFQPLVPALKIFLGSNYLTTLPGELFNLDQLTVLSLRGNQLRELPPGIGKLHNLRELNLSQNSLHHLPYEILDLFSDIGSLQSLQLHPNPFYEPITPNDRRKVETSEGREYQIDLGNHPTPHPGMSCGIHADHQRRIWSTQWEVSYKYRTVTRFIDICGNILKGPSFPAEICDGEPHPSSPNFRNSKTCNSIPVAGISDSPEPPNCRGNLLSRAPSLLEVALNACSKTSQLSDLSSYLPQYCQYIPDLLAGAVMNKESGGSKCAICKRNFIIPRTQWIEWWEIHKVVEKTGTAVASPLRQMENERDAVESMVPLMRSGCSWLCVPDRTDSLVVGEERRMDVDLLNI